MLEQLKNIGLSDNEAKVYLAMLELGPSSVMEIASKAEINRPTAYVQIESLKKRILERYWQPISDKAKTRKELTALGAQRFIHTPKTWQENIRQAIESRTK